MQDCCKEELGNWPQMNGDIKLGRIFDRKNNVYYHIIINKNPDCPTKANGSTKLVEERRRFNSDTENDYE